MPPRLNIWGACLSVIGRSRPLASCPQQARVAAVASRGFADNTPTFPPRPPPESGSILPSRTNASATTPIDAGDIPDTVSGGLETANDHALAQLQMISQGLAPFDPALDGHSFPIPETLPEGTHLKNRYDPALVQITKLIMRDGKLSKAQRDVAMILNCLRTSPPPKINPARPLLPGSPPPSHLPLNPVLYLSLALDSVAPLLRIRNFAGIAGGGAALPVPVPLALRQRRRQAFTWLLEVVDKKPSRGSGRAQFAHRIAEEIIAIAEGRSTVWDKRQQVHKLGTSARANLTNPLLVKRLQRA